MPGLLKKGTEERKIILFEFRTQKTGKLSNEDVQATASGEGLWGSLSKYIVSLRG